MHEGRLKNFPTYYVYFIQYYFYIYRIFLTSILILLGKYELSGVATKIKHLGLVIKGRESMYEFRVYEYY